MTPYIWDPSTNPNSSAWYRYILGQGQAIDLLWTHLVKKLPLLHDSCENIVLHNNDYSVLTSDSMTQYKRKLLLWLVSAHQLGTKHRLGWFSSCQGLDIDTKQWSWMKDDHLADYLSSLPVICSMEHPGVGETATAYQSSGGSRCCYCLQSS